LRRERLLRRWIEADPMGIDLAIAFLLPLLGDTYECDSVWLTVN